MFSEFPMRIGIDIGGTFTDFVVFHPDTGKIKTLKLISTPEDPAEAVLEGLGKAIPPQHSLSDVHIIHGSTIATNALLERKGAATALITTRGFRDILQIGRQNRPSLYEFNADPPEPLVPDHLRFEVSERVDHLGQVLVPLNLPDLGELISQLKSHKIESVAVCLLFSFLRPENEQVISRRLRTKGFFVSQSSEISPEFREYERTSTTVINAYVSPILDRYLSRLEGSLHGNHLHVMQSNGGVMNLQEARRAGVRCILSGPAGGVVGSGFVAENSSLAPQVLTDDQNNSGDSTLKVITFDMGGTSTDVSLIDASPRVTSESEIGGYPIRIPVLDIHTIGAGGGSIASVDLGGALRVGPESAGANPGPACYALGDLEESLPTVTDANLILGRLDAANFLGGKMPLDTHRAVHALSFLGEQLNLDPIQAALGVVEVVNAHMERALRLISLERGYDPRDFTLLSFGGAGGLHASDLAFRLGIHRIIIPPMASTFSAFGMLTADVVKDYTQTIMYPDSATISDISSALEPLVDRANRDLATEGFSAHNISIERFVDIRYQGQSYELTVVFDSQVRERFHEMHRQAYGYARPDAPLECVNVRVRSVGEVESPNLSSQPPSDPDPLPAYIGTRKVVYSADESMTPFYRWEALKPGNIIQGPAIIIRDDTTVLINPDDSVFVDQYGDMIITIGG